MPILKLTFPELDNNQKTIDVRTPAEFSTGHIPGAVNIPLFTNDERVQVGTTYKQKSKEKAILLGLDMVGPKMSSFILDTKKLKSKQIAVYCWRGGMRSGSMAWLLDLYGFEVIQLVGGYKAYRNHVLDFLDKSFKFKIISGKTGTGKTRLLEMLRNEGFQVLNLEALANHKGSAFGHLGENTQPRNEHFENMIVNQLAKFDIHKTIWLEDESRQVGSCTIPAGIWAQKINAPKVFVDIPRELRIKNILEDYGNFTSQELIAGTDKIQKKLGGSRHKEITAMIADGQIPLAADALLDYYDKCYTFDFEKSTVEKHLIKAESLADALKGLMALS